MAVRVALALLLVGCLPRPQGRCAADPDCPSGLFCADGVCQGPPLAALEAVPARPFSRGETLRVRARVSRAHGTPSVRVVFAGTAIDAQREAEGAFGADVPLALAPAGEEGPVALAMVVRDDLGHQTALPASVLVDDKPPRVFIDASTVPTAPVVRGTSVAVRFTVEDLTAVTVAEATQNADQSYTLTLDTALAPAADAVWNKALSVRDAAGNVASALVRIPVTRLKYATAHPAQLSMRSLVLTDQRIFASGSGELWFLRRSDGSSLVRSTSGGTQFDEIATDGSRLWYALSDGSIRRMDSSGNALGGGAASSRISAGPILSGSDAIVPAALERRLYAATAGNVVVAGSPIADLTGNTPAIGPDGTTWSGAVQALVFAAFDGKSWNGATSRAATAAYRGSPAFRAPNQLLMSTAAGAIDAFTLPVSGDPASVQVVTALSGASISAPTIAADGTATVTTSDSRVIAVNPNGVIRWDAILPAPATAPPAHGSGDLVYVGTISGQILALDLRSGSTVWSHDAGAAVRGPLAPGCDGVLYAATDRGVIALVIDHPGLADSLWPRPAHDVRGSGDSRRKLRSAAGGCLE